MKLFNGDCLEVMKDLPDNSIDFILTDLPYGLLKNQKWDNIIPYNLMWAELKRIRKEKTAVALFGAEPFSSHLRLSNLSEYKYDWIWEKEQGSNFGTVKYMPFKVYENISIFYKKLPTYNPQMTKGKPYKDTDRKRYVKHLGTTIKKPINNKGTRYPRNIIKYSNDTKKGKSYHPTQKPVALLEYLIKTYTLENEIVLDFTMGSGSTGVACVNTNRNFIGIELDKEYFNIAKDRIFEKD